MIRRDYAPTLLRLGIAALFLSAGIPKLINPAGPIGLLTGLGFPVPVLFAWLLIAAEVLGGLAMLVGWKVRYAAIPLAIVLFVALVTVTLPLYVDGKGGLTNVMFHVLGILGLISLMLTGAGAAGLDKEV